MDRLLAFCRVTDRLLAVVARASGWLFLVTIVVIVFDVITRKIGYQLPELGSSRLQELEWHFAAMLFLGWIGYGVVRDTHVRIDVFTGHLAQARKDRIDLWGTALFAIPYGLLLVPLAYSFFEVSLLQLESSDAPNGLPARFVVKGVMVAGFALILSLIHIYRCAAAAVCWRRWASWSCPSWRRSP